VPQKKEHVQPKHPKEARAAHGVAVPIDEATGEEEPAFMTPWNRTGKKLLSVKGTEEVHTTINDKCAKRGGKDAAEWKEFAGMKNPFKEPHGDDWRTELRKVPQFKKHAMIADMIDHIIAQGNQMFANARHKETWMCCRDHLKILWEGQTVAHLKSLKCLIAWHPERTSCDRFICPQGQCNNDLPERCKGTSPGDTPEFQQLDAHLFADAAEANSHNIDFSHLLPENHPQKCSASAPNRMFDSVCRTIDNCFPAAKRIKQDVHHIEQETIQQIIDAEGCCMPDDKKSVRKGNRKDAEREEKRGDNKNDLRLLIPIWWLR